MSKKLFIQSYGCAMNFSDSEIVASILKKEGGAVGLKPLVDAAKELGASKKDLLDILKKMKSISSCIIYNLQINPIPG